MHKSSIYTPFHTFGLFLKKFPLVVVDDNSYEAINYDGSRIRSKSCNATPARNTLVEYVPADNEFFLKDDKHGVVHVFHLLERVSVDTIMEGLTPRKVEQPTTMHGLLNLARNRPDIHIMIDNTPVTNESFEEDGQVFILHPTMDITCTYDAMSVISKDREVSDINGEIAIVDILISAI